MKRNQTILMALILTLIFVSCNSNKSYTLLIEDDSLHKLPQPHFIKAENDSIALKAVRENYYDFFISSTNSINTVCYSLINEDGLQMGENFSFMMEDSTEITAFAREEIYREEFFYDEFDD